MSLCVGRETEREKIGNNGGLFEAHSRSKKKKRSLSQLTRLGGDGSSSVSFLVPSKYGTSPPTPRPDSSVTIEQSPTRRVVVRSWVGKEPKFESREDVDAAFAALVADADRAGLIVGAPPKEGGIQGWTAGYDSPMTDEGKRRHEVMLPLVMRKSEVAPAGKGGGYLVESGAVAAASAGRRRSLAAGEENVMMYDRVMYATGR